jgi:hypothetical protein
MGQPAPRARSRSGLCQARYDQHRKFSSRGRRPWPANRRL